MFKIRMDVPCNTDDRRAAVAVGTLDEYVKVEWYDHMPCEIIREYHEDYRVPRKLKIRSRVLLFVDCWAQMDLRCFVYETDFRVNDNCFVASHENLSHVRSLGQLLSMITRLDKHGQVEMGNIGSSVCERQHLIVIQVPWRE